jgi:hypothetical protein
MTQLSPGDRVICRIKDGKISNVYEATWDDVQVFDIISVVNDNYIIYVPQDMALKQTFVLDKAHYKQFNASAKFIDSTVCIINEHEIIDVYSKLDGQCCSKCNEFISMAEPSKTAESFICWSCKKYPSYR